MVNSVTYSLSPYHLITDFFCTYGTYYKEPSDRIRGKYNYV